VLSCGFKIATVFFSAIDSISQGTLEVKGKSDKFCAFFIKNLKKTPNFVKLFTSKTRAGILVIFITKLRFWGRQKAG